MLLAQVDAGTVFSTHVEMFLRSSCRLVALRSFLHACGDVSSFVGFSTEKSEFSPRMWRCFYLTHSVIADDEVFSTHVEMFRTCTASTS